MPVWTVLHSLSMESALLRTEPEAFRILLIPSRRGESGLDVLLGRLEPLDIAPRRRGKGSRPDQLDHGPEQVDVVGHRVEGDDDPA